MSALGSVPSTPNLKSVDGLLAAMDRAGKDLPYGERAAAGSDFFKKAGAALDTDVLIGAFSKPAGYAFRAEGEKEILKRPLTPEQLKTIVSEGEFSRDTRVAAAERLVQDHSATKELMEAAGPIVGKVARAYSTDDIGTEERILRAMLPSRYVQERLAAVASGYGTDGSVRGMCSAGYILGFGISNRTSQTCKNVLSAPLEHPQGMRLMVRGLVEQHAKGNQLATDVLVETAQSSPSAHARAEVVGHVGMQTGKPWSTPVVLTAELSGKDWRILDGGLRDRDEIVRTAAVEVVEKNLGKGSQGLIFALTKLTDTGIESGTRVALLGKVEEYAAKPECSPYNKRDVMDTLRILLKDNALRLEAKRVFDSLQPA